VPASLVHPLTVVVTE
jgi:hypothetical protein